MQPLGPKLQACPVELIRQRHDRNGRTEYLIRWGILSLENDTEHRVHAPSADNSTENILMWMSTDEVYANCPMLLGERRKEEKTFTVFPPNVKLDETSLLEMEADIRNLVRRATWQMSSMAVPQPSILNTIHVLSAYASIGSLTGAFKETGALDLLMKMLCNQETQIRHSASKMLRALASHDSGSRAYVLLSLSQQDGIEQHMDFDSRYTLLELFAETASSEENLMPFDEIPLPQIPGKLLFSLVKRYLCATALMDKLNSIKELEGEYEHSVPSSAVPGGNKELQCEFDFSMAMANFILELVWAMGWDRSRQCRSLNARQPWIGRSIFKPQIPTCIATAPATLLPQKGLSTFKLPSAFPSRSSYTEYVQEKLVHGMRVRMLESYEKVSAGDEGEFLQSNNGTPPVQVYWESLGRTYWVHWHMIEIVGASCYAEQKAQEKISKLTDSLRQDAANQKTYRKPLVGLYSLPYLTDPVNENPETLSRAEWWEMLFFIKKLEQTQQQELVQLIQQNQKLSELDEGGLVQLSVSRDLALQLLHALSERCRGCTRSDLHRSHVYLKYFFSKEGAERNSPKRGATPEKCSGALKAVASETPKKELLSEVPSPDLPTAEKTDTHLTAEFLKMEGLPLPGTLDEKAKAFCSVKMLGKKSILEQLADALELILKSSCDSELQMAGLRFMAKTLEETLGQERQATKAEMELALREKMVKMLVELLGQRAKETLSVGLALQVVYGLLTKYDWQMLFGTQGGLRAVLLCMREHSGSALVQQAGLAVLKVLLGAGKCDLPGPGGKSYPRDHASVHTMQELFSSIGSASSKDTDSLLDAIPAAIEKMLDIPGASTAVQNGLLVLNKLISHYKALEEPLGSCNLHSVLQRCCQAGQSFNMTLAQIVLSRLAKNPSSLSQEAADHAASSPLKDLSVSKLLSGLHANHVFKELGVILEHCLCGKAGQPPEDSYDLLADALLLEDMVRLGSEKDWLLGMLRLLNKLLDRSQDDLVPWHKCIEPCLSSMSAHINHREIVQESINFLHHLGTLNKDCAVMMCCMNTRDLLTKILEKHGSSQVQLAELGELLSQCEKYASLHKKMTVSILAGCIQMVLGQIEEHRRSRQPVNIPFFDVLLHNLCQGCSTEMKEDKCWERVEVSSNPQQASKLMDGNPKTYWESNGSTGSHYINVYMHRGVIVQQMSMLVASEDSSYMPSRIIVMGGDSASSITTKLNMLSVPPLASRVMLLENVSHFWPIIQIKIKCCRQGGVDTRVRGIEVLGPKPTFWPIFKEQLCRRTFLFYTTKAHTWCQEISEDRMQLLQLFNRLNSALRHEQMFADRFLPDDEAAQALGKTCWEALINPLVQSITSPDASGISPLSWLLSEYLENMEAARSSRTRAAIFNSRVRRLSHLLVHVDSGTPEVEELKPPIKSNGKNRKNKESNSGAVKATGKKPDSTTGITQCWKAVVQQQVKRFLESSWQAPDFVERYCNTYLHLRTAMEELFGQQMSFMLSLCRGFSGGLLQLSFLTAMHVSEQFARYIDTWIQKSWADSGNVETLRRLQQSLEPILFLAGLELANTFEHFYRYYLGDRLLSQGRTWLECAVVDHIGLCFPNRFPQQMLKNLSELEEQQQQFHLFQLQQLDKHLLELDQEGKRKEEELGEMMEEQPFSEDEEVEVKVLALSPRCWTISPVCYLEEPAKFFPPSLSQRLSKFADFYTQSHSHSALERMKPRRLQWTWLGHAELQYRGSILHISTLQMYILLCFNSAEEISVDTLLQTTKLSPALLHGALQPLTKENGILTQNQNTLKLNEGALAQRSGQRLWLLPKQRYLNVEEDEGSALERKRNIICCLLTQILKEEKEIHIDNLVFKVIDTCRKVRGGPAPKTLSPSCSSTDVLSCILRLLDQGSVRRHKSCPEVLEYVCTEHPTLAVPKNQRQVTFQTMQIKKAPAVPSTEKKQTFSTFR